MRILIAGGGIAGLEALLALRFLAAERLEVDLLAPERELVYRPRAVLEPFGLGEAQRYSLGQIAREHAATYRPEALAEVDPDRHLIKTDDGEERSYGALIVAIGARPTPGLGGAITFYAERAGELASLERELLSGAVSRLAFVVPTAVTWSLPAYELALMTAYQARAHDLPDLELTVVTPEERPMALFGPQGSEAIAALLRERGISVLSSSYAEELDDGTLRLRPGRRLEVDRVVSLPRLVGPRVPGLPHDDEGFIPVDEHGRVRGVKDVYAAGDVTTFQVKQGGLAAQQADAVAEMIAAVSGAPVEPNGFRPVLRGLLLTRAEPEYLRAVLSGGHGDDFLASTHALWWPSSKVAARYLAPYLESHDRAKHAAVSREPADALPIEVELRDLPSP